MNKNVLDTDLSGKVAVVTGAGGVLCGAFAKTLGPRGREGRPAGPERGSRAELSRMRSRPRAALPRLTSATCWTRPSAMKWRSAGAEQDLGNCDILVNGAGGNNPRATTDKEYFEEGDIDADTEKLL